MMIDHSVGRILEMIAVSLLVMSSDQSVRGECTREFVRGPCEFTAYCVRHARGLELPRTCHASANWRVDVQLSLRAPDAGPLDAEPGLLAELRGLRVAGAWPDPDLSFLKHTPNLKNLTIIDAGLPALPTAAFHSLSHLETIDLSGNQLEEVDGVFSCESSPCSVRVLSLSHNALQSLAADALAELGSLVELDLSHNHIAELGGEPFQNLTSLEILRLNDNRIINLNGALNHLPNLKHLYLRGNELQNVDLESLQVIYHLETFDASSNKLAELPAGVFLRHWQHVTGVYRILLARNNIARVPAAAPRELLARFTHHSPGDFTETTDTSDTDYLSEYSDDDALDVSTELDLSDNTISHVEFDAFHSLVHLVSLDLSSNLLIDFVIDPADLRFIKNLNLSSNYIVALEYDNFFSASNLQQLDLSHNRLEYMPDENFGSNLKLRVLNLAYNVFLDEKVSLSVKFSPEGGLLDLRGVYLAALLAPQDSTMHTLLLGNNNITNAADIHLRNQYHLRELDLSKNLLETLEDSSLDLPTALLLLDLSENAIKKVSTGAFGRLGQLRTLRLRGNRLGALDAGAFAGLALLQNLDLSHNHLAFLDASVLQDLKSLRVLSLRDNQLAELNDQAWLGHKNEITVYFDGNSISCEWLSGALTSYNNGLSRMRPAAVEGGGGAGWGAVGGVPCRGGELLRAPEPHADPRLLLATHRILDALREQNFYLRRLSNSV